MITTYHWDWSTFKIKDEAESRMLYETFSEEAILEEITDFKVLSEDRLVQMTVYGEHLKVAANFSNEDFEYEGDLIKPKS